MLFKITKINDEFDVIEGDTLKHENGDLSIIKFIEDKYINDSILSEIILGFYPKGEFKHAKICDIDEL